MQVFPAVHGCSRFFLAEKLPARYQSTQVYAGHGSVIRKIETDRKHHVFRMALPQDVMNAEIKEDDMQCDACGIAIPSGDERNHQSRIFCEDCYMVALSPLKTCDPWAVHSARNCEKLTGNDKQVTRIQSEILQILKTEGAMEPATLLGKLGGNMQLADLQREFSILRHMEKVKGEKRGQDILWRLW